MSAISKAIVNNGVLQFKKVCVHCGYSDHEFSYSCKGCSETWHNEYRVIDIDIDYSVGTRKILIDSYNNYRFDHPDGILQYAGIPFVENKSKGFISVGLTPLYHLKNLSKRFESRLFVKSEGGNPSGCFKDRETLACIMHSHNNKQRKAVIYSSGNAAASAAIFAQKTNFHLITFVAGDTYNEKIEYIQSHGSDVIVIGDSGTTFEEGYRLYSKINSLGFFNDSGYDDWSVRNPYRVQGDKTTALEIVKQLGEGDVPDYVIVPTANGSCLAGMWKGFRELYKLGIINKLPKMVSAGIKNASPIAKAVRKKEIYEPMRCDLSKVSPDDSEIGSIILAEEGYDSLEATKAVLESGGLAVEVNSKDIGETLRLFLKEEETLARAKTIMPEPVSLISIAAINKIRETEAINKSTLIVSILTGAGIKAREKIEDILENREELQQQADRILDRKQEEQYPEAKHPGERINVSSDIESVANAFYSLKTSAPL